MIPVPHEFLEEEMSQSFSGKNIASLKSSMIMKANLVLQHVSAAEAIVRHASPSTNATSSRKLGTTSVCCSTTVKGHFLKNFVGAAVRLRTRNPAQMARFLHSGGSGYMNMEMIQVLAKVKLEELKL